MAERFRAEKRKNPREREREREREETPSPSASGSGRRRRRGRPRKTHNLSSPSTPPPPLTEISSTTSFFKVFFPDASSLKLIPPAFCQHIDKRAVDGAVYLRGPSGHKWQVDLMQSEDDDGDDLFFEAGWKDFVFDHSIQTGEILVFRYEGQRSFSVQLFDRSACEKDSAFSARPSKYSKGQNCDGPPGLEQRANMALVVVKKEEPVDEADFMAPRMLVPAKTPEQQSYKRWLSDNTNSRSEVTKPKRVPTIVSQRRPVTEQEISDTLKRAKAFTSDNPYVAIPMRNSYVYISFFLNLPTEFVKDHLPKGNAKFTMWDPTGRSWPISYVCYNARHGALSGGWGKAAVANNLEIHDVVVFELVKKNQLKMHIYRVVEEITPFRRGCDVEREAELTR